MKVSREWLQTFFEQPLPDARQLADALTFHAFEIEGVEKKGDDDMLEVKVTPNRGHDCLCHRGIARELSAILALPMRGDGLRESIVLEPRTSAVSVAIEDPELCARYVAGFIRGVKAGPSPEWLRVRLEAIGQKPINNVVDATNYVMFDLGQPLHAFDAGKLSARDGTHAIEVRRAKNGERMLALDGKEYALSPSNLIIADANAVAPIGIAGVKGGMRAGVSEATTDIILESANFDGVSVRKTAQELKLRTDASDRFQQVISPELAAYGIRAAARLIARIAGGEVAGFADEYPAPQARRRVSVSARKTNAVLGTALTPADIGDVFRRLDLPHERSGDAFAVAVPFERLDLAIPEDLIEEIARVVGYDEIPATPLPPFPKKPEINKDFYAAERAREDLIARGYSEVCTSVFAEGGERSVSNKVGGERPYLRGGLLPGLQDALERNVRNKDLLGLTEVKLFEIGAIWRSGEEIEMVATAGEREEARERQLTTSGVDNRYEDLPLPSARRFHPFSKYPFIVRDIALWVSADTRPEDVLDLIRASAGEFLVRCEKFDEFEKGGRTSYAFRLVFQSFERTLTDAQANALMEKICAEVETKGWEVR